MRPTRRAVALAAAACSLATLFAASLWLDWPGSTLSRDEVIHTALRAPGSDLLPANRVTGVKLIRRFELPQVTGQDGAADARPWDRVWVVVLKGELIAPSFPGGQAVTYTVEVIRDRRPAVVELYFEDGPGDLPANWNLLL